jgi:hypothetical protein
MKDNGLFGVALAAGLLVCMILFAMRGAQAIPTGATVLSNATSGVPVSPPDSRTDDGGTITTLLLNSLQQDYNWKGYVGNITGRLALDNAAGYTIYDWPISVSKEGELYVSRASSLDFVNVTCANQTIVSVDDAFFGMAGSQTDSINRTFNATSHQGFIVGSTGGTSAIAANSCKSTATYVNDSSQVLDGSHYFQQLLLQDLSGNLIFVSIINASLLGYDESLYDFQMIVPENQANLTATTYYFWTELS